MSEKGAKCPAGLWCTSLLRLDISLYKAFERNSWLALKILTYLNYSKNNLIL